MTDKNSAVIVGIAISFGSATSFPLLSANMSRNFASFQLGRLAGLLLAALVLAACSNLQSQAAPETAAVDANDHRLMAEMARERKDWPIAAEQYFQAALLSDDTQTARRATEFAGQFGYTGLQLQAAQRWLELATDDPAAHGQAGRVYLRQRDGASAHYHFRRLLGEAPTDEAYLTLQAGFADDLPESAVTDLFKRFMRSDPDSRGLQLALLRTALQSDDYELALDIAARIHRAVPESLEPRVIMAQALMALGQSTPALELIESLRTEPAILGIELTYVRLLAASGQRPEAYRELAELADEFGVQTDFVRLFAMISLSADDLDTAERNFTRLLAAETDNYENLYYLGRIALLRGNYQQGIQFFARVGAGGYLVPAQLAAVQAYESLGDFAGGLEHLQIFQQNYPRRAIYLEPARARLLFAAGRTTQALAVFDDLLALQPGLLENRVDYAVLLDLAGKTEQSIKLMRRVVDSAPTDANSLNTLGYTLANRDRQLAEAYQLIRRALEISPDSAAVIDSMGWVLYRLGRNDEALSYLRQAHALQDDPEVSAHLAELLWATGAVDEASDLLERSLAENPGDAVLLETRARMRR